MDKRHAAQVQQMSEKLADYYGLSLDKIKIMNQYALIHLQYQEIKNMLNDMNSFSEQSYDVLKEKTELGSMIAKRMQLAQKCEDITRAHIEDSANEKFLKEMLLIQPEIESQIILLADLYITMRGPKPYKRPMAHSLVFKSFQTDLGQYFDHDLKERFFKIS